MMAGERGCGRHLGPSPPLTHHYHPSGNHYSSSGCTMRASGASTRQTSAITCVLSPIDQLYPHAASHMRMCRRVFDTYGVEFDIVTNSIMSRMLSLPQYMPECTRNNPNASTTISLCGRISGRISHLILRV